MFSLRLSFLIRTFFCIERPSVRRSHRRYYNDAYLLNIDERAWCMVEHHPAIPAIAARRCDIRIASSSGTYVKRINGIFFRTLRRAEAMRARWCAASAIDSIDSCGSSMRRCLPPSSMSVVRVWSLARHLDNRFVCRSDRNARRACCTADLARTVTFVLLRHSKSLVAVTVRFRSIKSRCARGGGRRRRSAACRARVGRTSSTRRAQTG